MFFHKHPYPPFIPGNASRLIVGTLPPPRFSTGFLKSDDVNFCYGSRDGLLWPVLDRIFQLGLTYDNSEKAIHERKQFLIARRIGICDIVQSCYRNKVDASDLGMERIELRDLLGILKEHPQIHTVLFTGGNSKNGPEYLFRKLLKGTGLQLRCVDDQIPRIFELCLDKQLRKIRMVSLIAPSGSANRAIGSLEVYKRKKALNPAYNTIDFRVEQYQKYF